MAYPSGSTVTNQVDPISRIEGHLGVAVNVVGGKITEAYAHGNLWRGFENFLLGRDVNDAITFTQRICGVCPVPHGMTATYAADTVLGYSAGHITFASGFGDGKGVPAKAVVIRNLVLGMEFLMSSITHFYHLAAPSYVQGPMIPPWTPYFANDFYHPYLRSSGVLATAAWPQNSANGYSKDLWSTVIRSYVTALRIRRLTFEAGALFAGRMPMTSVFIGGGVLYDHNENITARVTMFTNLAKEIGLFIIQEYLPIALALGALYPNFDNLANANVLKNNFPGLWSAAATGNSVAPDSTNTGYGAGLGCFLAWGGFPDTSASGTLALSGGLKNLNGADSFEVKNKADVATYFLAATGVQAQLKENIANSRYGVATADEAAYGGATGVTAYPGAVSRTKPVRENGYTYMKAPRWNNLACEVGPMARMYVNGTFKNGSGLVGTIGISDANYLKTNSFGVTGLDPLMILPDVAVALVRMGLATLTLGAATGTVVGNATGGLPGSDPFAPYTQTQINGYYVAADSVITGVITAWISNLSAGLSTIDRLRGRAVESFVLIQAILGGYTKGSGSWQNATGYATNTGGTWGGGWLADAALLAASGATWGDRDIPPGTVQGWGGTEAPRGALMHQCEITDGKISKYQCIVPTTWNGSPCVGNATGVGTLNNHGAIEAAVIGVPFSPVTTTVPAVANQGGAITAAGGVEVMRVAQSFDPCIACAVH